MAEDGYEFPRPFPSTHWSSVGRAGREGEGTTDAMGRLLMRYLPALKTHLVFQMRMAPEQADDVLHSFVSEKILEQDLLRRADSSRGRFRSFLRTALERYAISRHRRANAAKRSPEDGPPISLHDLAEPPSGVGDPSDAYDVAWARELLAEVVRRMRAECADGLRDDIWAIFERRLLNPILDGSRPPAYADLVEEFDFASPAQAANLLVTAKRMFARVMRSVIAEYAGTDGEIDREIEELKAILSRSGAGSAR